MIEDFLSKDDAIASFNALKDQAARTALWPKEVAPWPDYRGNPIHEGDTIVHPDKTSGVVCWDRSINEPEDAWRVDYGSGDLSRLCLQVGPKGMAVVRQN